MDVLTLTAAFGDCMLACCQFHGNLYLHDILYMQLSVVIFQY